MIIADTLVVIGLATISLGSIKEADGPQEHSFWLRNAGQETVSIHQGYTSCGCTTVDFPKEAVISPGDSTCVTLRFNPRGKGGEFEETATLVYSSNKRVHLSLVGTCITSEETLLRQFPIRVNDAIRLSADRFDLGIMRAGETKERGVVVLHRDEGDRQERMSLSFRVDETTPKGLQHISLPLEIPCADSSSPLTVNVVFDVLVR